MAINPDLLKPFVKVSIRDLVRSRVEEIQMVWIQGTVSVQGVKSLLIILIVKSLQKEQNSTNLLL